MRVPEQSSRLLTILLERAGTVVTREELRRLMWPAGEYLNHDHSISNAINQLRNILRDDSRAPVFIETLPKRGYRFMAPVERQSSDSPDAEHSPDFEHPQDSDDLLQTFSPALELVPLQPAVAAAPPLVETPSAQHVLRTAGLRFRWLLTGALVALAILVGFGFFKLRTRPPAPMAGYISMGIVPFDSNGPEAAQLAGGFRLDLTDALSQLPKIQVRAAHSFSQPRGVPDDVSIRALAAKLQLDTLLFGTFTQTGDQIQLQMELVRGSDAVHLGSFHYSGTKEDLTTMRNDVQRDVFARLESAALNGKRVPGSTDNPRAYEDYLKARTYLLQWTDESLNKVLDGFRAAIAEDPSFAHAYAGMASAYVLAAEHSLAPRDACFRQAELLANKAIELNPAEAEAHAVLGFILFRRDWDAQASERELREAIALDPNQAIQHVWLALVLGNTGRFAESLRQVDMAHEDDPLWPPVYITEMYLASCAGLNNRSLAAADKLLTMMPDWPLAHDQHAGALWYAGRFQEAIAEWRLMASLEKDAARVALEDRGLRAFRRGGVAAYARIRVEAIRKKTPEMHPNDFEPAEWYLDAGDRREALASIQDMIQRRDPEALQLAVSPAYASLHQDPEFLAMLARVGLTLPPQHAKTAAN